MLKEEIRWRHLLWLHRCLLLLPRNNLLLLKLPLLHLLLHPVSFLPLLHLLLLLLLHMLLMELLMLVLLQLQQLLLPLLFQHHFFSRRWYEGLAEGIPRLLRHLLLQPSRRWTT